MQPCSPDKGLWLPYFSAHAPIKNMCQWQVAQHAVADATVEVCHIVQEGDQAVDSGNNCAVRQQHTLGVTWEAMAVCVCAYVCVCVCLGGWVAGEGQNSAH